MSDPIGLCPVCAADKYQGDCPQCRERETEETVVDAEVVSKDEWQKIESKMAQDKLAAEAEKIAAGIRTNRVITVMVHGHLAHLNGVPIHVSGFVAEFDADSFKQRNEDERTDPVQLAEKLLLEGLDAKSKKV